MPPEPDWRGLRFGISEKSGDICPAVIIRKPDSIENHPQTRLHMKRFAYIILAATSALTSCSTYDHEAILEQLRDHEERIQKLESICNKLNSNVEAIQTILTALEQNDYVTDIVKVMEDGVEVGYSITFAKGGTVTIYHGTDGADSAAPQVGIRKAQDGEYYWTADGEWMTDENGEKIPAVVADDPDGEYVTPLFRVEDGKWFVSGSN